MLCNFARARLTRAPRLHHKRQERQVAGTLDRHSELTLMPGARAGLSSRADLPTLGYKTMQPVRLLVINVSHFLLTEKARLAPTSDPTPATALLAGL